MQPLLQGTCPQAGAGAAGACVDFEVTCWDQVQTTGGTTLLLRTVTDCDPGSVTFGQILATDYRDPANAAVVVVPVGNVVPCPNAGLDVELQCAWDLVIVTPGTPNIVTATQFWQVISYDETAAVPVTGPNPIDVDGNAYTVLGTAIPCPEVEIQVEGLCEYDPATGDRIGEFFRRWFIISDGPNVGDLVDLAGSPSADVQLDGVTPYVLSGGSITRNCQNEVPCDNDPCVPLTVSRTPNTSQNILVSSLQIDIPFTNPGTRFKYDLFDNASLGMVGNGPAHLSDWITNGLGQGSAQIPGNLPPRDEVFIWRGATGLPFNAPVQAATPLWQAGQDIIIPGWAVIATSYAGGLFIEIEVDLTLDNPFNCDLATFETDPANFPGVFLGAQLAQQDAAQADAIANLGNPNQPFVIGGVGAASGESADIYSFQTGNPVTADSVVLCSTITKNSVCFSGEAAPLDSISGINPTGQVVFGPLFVRQSDGTVVTQPQGDPIPCNGLEPFRDVCGTCVTTLNIQPAVAAAPSPPSPTFDLAFNNASPISYSMIVRDNQGAGYATNLVNEICQWLQTADPRDIMVINTVQGPAPWAGNAVPMVICRWMVDVFDCTSVPDQVFINANETIPHPDDCPLPPEWIAWRDFRHIPGFLNWGAGGFRVITINGPELYQFNQLANPQGPALRVIDCGDALDNELQAFCDVDGTEFLRRYTVTNGVVSTTDTLLDGTTPYVATGPVSPSDSLCRFEAEPCQIGTVCTAQVANPGQAAGAPPQTTPPDTVNWGALTFPSLRTGVTLTYTSDPAFVAAIDTAWANGEYVLLVVQDIFGQPGVPLLIGGAGLSNVAFASPVLSFDYDPQVTIDDLTQNCPAALTLMGPALQATLGVWPIVFGGFPIALDAVQLPSFSSFSLTTVPQVLPSIATSVCGPTQLEVLCDLIQISSTTDFTVDVAGAGPFAGPGSFIAGVDFPVGQTVADFQDTSVLDPNDPQLYGHFDTGVGDAFFTNGSTDYSECGAGVHQLVLLVRSANGALLGNGGSIEINADGTIQQINLGGPQVFNYPRQVGAANQQWALDGNGTPTPIGPPVDAAGALYIVQGTLEKTCPPLPDFLGNLDLRSVVPKNRSDESQATIQLTTGAGALNVGTGLRGYTATVIVGTGEVDGIPVPQGYSLSVEARPGAFLDTDVQLEAFGIGGYWLIVTKA